MNPRVYGPIFWGKQLPPNPELAWILINVIHTTTDVDETFKNMLPVIAHFCFYKERMSKEIRIMLRDLPLTRIDNLRQTMDTLFLHENQVPLGESRMTLTNLVIFSPTLISTQIETQ